MVNTIARGVKVTSWEKLAGRVSTQRGVAESEASN